MRGEGFLLTAGEDTARWPAALEVPLHISSDPLVVLFPHEKRPRGPPVSLASWEILHSGFVKRIPGTVFYAGAIAVMLPFACGCGLKCCSQTDSSVQLYSLGPLHLYSTTLVKMKDKLHYH